MADGDPALREKILYDLKLSVNRRRNRTECPMIIGVVQHFHRQTLPTVTRQAHDSPRA